MTFIGISCIHTYSGHSKDTLEKVHMGARITAMKDANVQ